MKVELHVSVRAHLEVRDPAVGVPVIWAKPARAPDEVEMSPEMLVRYYSAMNEFQAMQDEIWELVARVESETQDIRLT